MRPKIGQTAFGFYSALWCFQSHHHTPYSIPAFIHHHHQRGVSVASQIKFLACIVEFRIQNILNIVFIHLFQEPEEMRWAVTNFRKGSPSGVVFYQRRQQQLEYRSSSITRIVTSRYLSLGCPTLLYQDNHLLVIGKPPGWHSVPNEDRSTEKCLLDYCKRRGWGGGSRHDFLLPLHRLDQPCSGIQLYGKTSKAASRIQSQWKQVEKLYVCVLDERTGESMETLRRLSSRPDTIRASDDGNKSVWYTLGGYLNTNHRTVRISNHPVKDDQSHSVIEWKPLRMGNQCTTSATDRTAIVVRTRHGHRHLIRALVGQAYPLAGDMRYGAQRALPDQSVALHAYGLRLPTSLRLGKSLAPGRALVAPVPIYWKDWFRIRQEQVAERMVEWSESREEGLGP